MVNYLIYLLTFSEAGLDPDLKIGLKVGFSKSFSRKYVQLAEFYKILGTVRIFFRLIYYKFPSGPGFPLTSDPGRVGDPGVHDCDIDPLHTNHLNTG